MTIEPKARIVQLSPADRALLSQIIRLLTEQSERQMVHLTDTHSLTLPISN